MVLTTAYFIHSAYSNPYTGARLPTFFRRNPQDQREQMAAPRGAAQIKNPTREERLDWYMDAALKEVKGALRLAGEGKLRQSDLWSLLTFGQHMYAGMRDSYGIDLNSALLERERDNMGEARLSPVVGPAELPWPRLPPRRCPECSRVVAADAEPVTSEHPWSRSSFARLYPQEDRYELGGIFGFTPHDPGRAPDPWNIPTRPGTIYSGWGPWA